MSAALRVANSPKWARTVSVDVTSIAANSTLDFDVAISQAAVDDMVVGTAHDATNLPAGVVISHIWVPSAGTVRIRFANVTAAAIDPPARNFTFIAF